MTGKFAPLPHVLFGKSATILRPSAQALAQISLDSPARKVMTDLSRVEPVTTEPHVSIESANRKMMDHGVRLLLVLDDDCVIGVITATDILGEKPVQYMQKVNCTYGDILVEDIMTPADSLEALYLVDVERASVGDIIETLKHAGRQHALVIRVDERDKSQKICGIFSATHISRQLNARVDVPEMATSFAEVEVAIMR